MIGAVSTQWNIPASSAAAEAGYNLQEKQPGLQNTVPKNNTEESRQDRQSSSTGMDTVELSEKERKEVEALKARDKEVRAHEQAHKSAAGQYTKGGPSFEYQVGPDGKRYAVGGEVSIDLSEGRTPEETIQKANTVRSAALAPAEPSAQDRKVAARATQMIQEARAEVASEQQKNIGTNADTGEKEAAPPSELAEFEKTAGAPAEKDSNKTTVSPLEHIMNEPGANSLADKIRANASKAYQENSPAAASSVGATTTQTAVLSIAI
jgi:hypothetical protein